MMRARRVLAHTVVIVAAGLLLTSSSVFGSPAAEALDAAPFASDLQRGVSVPWQFALIILATFILEDPTTVMVGLLIAEGHVSLQVGVLAVFTGIFIGDLGLYVIGRVLGAQLSRWKWLAARAPTGRLDRTRKWIDRHGWSAILASRFIPGSRVPLYMGAGAVKAHAGRFALWTCGAVLIWAPVMVSIVIVLERMPGSPVARLLELGWPGLLGAAVVAFLVVRLVTLLVTRVGRSKIVAFVSRLWRWEFWPVWLMYLPIVPGWLRLAMKHRSLTVWTLADPGIPLGGLVGESKSFILGEIAGAFVIDFALIEPDEDPAARTARTRAIAEERGWTYPIVLKPDAGQRGAAVRRIATDDGATTYYEETPGPVLAQPLCSYEEEAGVFYVRHPDEPRGRIFSITSKRFPSVVGDGKSTLFELIWTHPRYRMQAKRFLQRHPEAPWTEPADGERVSLAFAGNHCQGVAFQDGAHLMTEDLLDAIEGVAKRMDGFHFGRFDLRYRNDEALKAGRDFTILELNGVTSESTNIYDSSFTLMRAWRTLREQWRLAFEIGAAHRARGLTPPTKREVVRAIVGYYRSREVSSVSD